MVQTPKSWNLSITALTLLSLLSGCVRSSNPSDSFNGLTLQMLVGSAQSDFCNQASQQFNQQQPKLENGTPIRLTCTAKGSGDGVTEIITLAQQLKAGTLPADSPQFPTLISLDGEIYQSQLIYQMNQLFPGQRYLPELTDAPLLASTPMVFMAPADLAGGLDKVEDLFKVLVTAKTHQQIDPASQPLNIHYVQTAPTRSNSGLQTLVAQFASVSGKRPEQLTAADISRYQSQVQQIQNKVTRYGISTNALAQAMVQNGPFWASVGSVYESSVIAANSALPPGRPRYRAIYPKVTFTSNMRVVLPTAPWVSADEKAAAEKVIAYLRSPEAQTIAANLGLRPGTPGVPLGAKFSPELGVQPQPRYDSYRPPRPEVVEAMLKSWQDFAKKPSLVVLVIDSSGSMQGEKMLAVQNTLQAYVSSLGPKDRIALMDFDSELREPVLIDSSPEGRNQGIAFISNLKVGGGTRLYDATLYARNWLQKNLQANAINAVLVMTDGEDTSSSIQLDQLSSELQKSGFDSDQRIGFFTIGYGKEGEFDPKALQQIAAANGGYYSKGDPATIARVMADLQVEF